MLMTKERPPSWREVERWAIGILLEEGAIKQCLDHGYAMKRWICATYSRKGSIACKT
jgi:hypothetical protein